MNGRVSLGLRGSRICIAAPNWLLAEFGGGSLSSHRRVAFCLLQGQLPLYSIYFVCTGFNVAHLWASIRNEEVGGGYVRPLLAPSVSDERRQQQSRRRKGAEAAAAESEDDDEVVS